MPGDSTLSLFLVKLKLFLKFIFKNNIFLQTVIFKHSWACSSPGDLGKGRLIAVGLGQGLRVPISSKFPGEPNVGPRSRVSGKVLNLV